MVVMACCYSAGVGRTGTYIVIDAMLDRIDHEQTLDVYGHVTCLRAQRNYMVQTEDQYVFIYEALLDAVQSGNTEVPADSLYLHVQHLTTLYVADDPRQPAVTGMELEFKVCCVYRRPTLEIYRICNNRTVFWMLHSPRVNVCCELFVSDALYPLQ